MTMAIAHKEDKVAVSDLVRAIAPPFSPADAVKEFVATLKAYRIHSVTGDNFGNEILQEQFRAQGVSYVRSLRNRSEIYLEFMPLVNSRQCLLLDDRPTLSQLLGLERRCTSGGRDKIDHGKSKHSHDDLINVAAGAIVLAASAPKPMTFHLPFVASQPTQSDGPYRDALDYGRQRVRQRAAGRLAS